MFIQKNLQQHNHCSTPILFFFKTLLHSNSYFTDTWKPLATSKLNDLFIATSSLQNFESCNFFLFTSNTMQWTSVENLWTKSVTTQRVPWHDLKLRVTETNYSEPVQYSLNIKHHFQNDCYLQTCMIPSHNSNLGLLQGNPAKLRFSCHKLTVLPLPLPQMMFCIQGSDAGSSKSVIIISSLLLSPTIPFDLMLDILCRLPVKLYLLHLLTLMW